MDSAKEEKKRLKSQAKFEKKKLKAQKMKPEHEPEPVVSKKPDKIGTHEPEPEKVIEPKVPWYKNPEWVRAIVGIASVIVAVIAILISLYY